MSKNEKTVVTTPAATEPKPAPAMLIAITELGKKHSFRAGSQRDLWFQSVLAYEGKPVADWLAHVATNVPKQRVKENAKTPHKSGAGFLGRFKELKLVQEVPAKS